MRSYPIVTSFLYLHIAYRGRRISWHWRKIDLCHLANRAQLHYSYIWHHSTGVILIVYHVFLIRNINEFIKKPARNCSTIWYELCHLKWKGCVIYTIWTFSLYIWCTNIQYTLTLFFQRTFTHYKYDRVILKIHLCLIDPHIIFYYYILVIKLNTLCLICLCYGDTALSCPPLIISAVLISWTHVINILGHSLGCGYLCKTMYDKPMYS